MQAKLIAKNNSHPANKKLAEWLEANLVALVKKGFVFEFLTVSPKDNSALLNYGITKTPALICKGMSCYGNVEIQKYLGGFLSGGAGGAAGDALEGMRSRGSILATPEDELYRDQMKEMSKDAMEAERGDDERSTSDEIKRRVDEAAMERTKRYDEDTKRHARRKGFSEAAAAKGTSQQPSGSSAGGKRPDNVMVSASVQPDSRAAGDNVQAAIQAGGKDDALLARLFEETT